MVLFYIMEGRSNMKNKFGVPCSKIKDKIKDVDIICTSEEQALAMAAGCHLAGKKAEVYMQNSGLCRCIDVALSLFKPYEIPLPKLLLSIRHKPYHHKFCGAKTKDLLKLMEWKKVEIVEQEC